MGYPMAVNRPDWTKVMDDSALAEDNGYVTITKGTAKLARSALRAQNEADYYHNYGYAEKELTELLEGK